MIELVVDGSYALMQNVKASKYKAKCTKGRAKQERATADIVAISLLAKKAG